MEIRCTCRCADLTHDKRVEAFTLAVVMQDKISVALRFASTKSRLISGQMYRAYVYMYIMQVLRVLITPPEGGCNKLPVGKSQQEVK